MKSFIKIHTLKVFTLIFGLILSSNVLAQDSLKNTELEIIPITRDFELEKIKKRQGTISDMDFAIHNANNDFDSSNYILYCEPFFADYNLYFDVLQIDYSVNYVFIVDTQSDEYYKNYDSVMTVRLKQKYGEDFLIVAQNKADSLGLLGTWYSDAKFLCGERCFRNYMDSLSSIVNNELLIKSEKRRVFIVVEIDTQGIVQIDTIARVQNELERQTIREHIERMPNWYPAYRLGKPTEMKYSFPLVLGEY